MGLTEQLQEHFGNGVKVYLSGPKTFDLLDDACFIGIKSRSGKWGAVIRMDSQGEILPVGTYSSGLFRLFCADDADDILGHTSAPAATNIMEALADGTEDGEGGTTS